MTQPAIPATGASGPVLTMRTATIAIVALTLFRILALALDTTDLFVDESQYWLWSQHLDAGYYSKPPMIAWLIRLTTALAGSDAQVFVRIGGPLCHMLTALILMQATVRFVEDGRVAPFVGLSFATLPAVALSSIFISTDTVMFVFLAGALWAYGGLIARRSAPLALLFGACIGLGMLSKYSMLFFVACIVLSALVLRGARIAWRDAVIAGVTALLVFSPNIAWNLANDIATVRHTSDNVGFRGFNLHLRGAAEFLLAQFAVVGPVLFGAMIWAAWRAMTGTAASVERHLVLLSWPIVLAFVGEALISRAYANWAVPAYAAGAILAVALLMQRTQNGIRQSLAINGLATIAIPLVSIFAAQVVLPGGAPVLQRYLGRAALSRDIAGIATQAGVTTIVSDDRDVLADLFYTLRDQPLTIAARRSAGFPRHYYEQRFALHASAQTPVLFVTRRPFSCTAAPATALETLRPAQGYWQGRTITAYRTVAGCLAPTPS